MSRTSFGEALRRARVLLQEAAVQSSEKQAHAGLLAELERAQAHAAPSRIEDQPVRHDLIAVICHDLRAPLSSVLMGAGFLQKSLAADPKAEPMRKIADAIARSGERMNHLVRDLHDVTHIEQGRFTLERHKQDAGAILDTAFERVVPLAATKSVKLDKHNEAGGLSINADKERLLQAIAKLAENALRSTAAGGTLRLSALKDGTAVRFIVADTGKGMDEERLAHAFDRAWHATQSPREGTGLGLALVQGIARAHDGDASVESRIGSGTTVAFTVPLAS